MTKEELLDIVYADRKAYIAEVGVREFDCLVMLVDDGTITTVEQLKEYGVTIPS